VSLLVWVGIACVVVGVALMAGPFHHGRYGAGLLFMGAATGFMISSLVVSLS